MPGILATLGPAFVWAAVAQGSGELIWWPYFAAKYGAAFLGLLLPAALIQFFVNREISRFTALTGNGIWQGFSKLSKWFTLPLFLLCFVNFLWLGGYASAGGTALFELTKFPTLVSSKFGSLFWTYILIFGFSLVFIFSKIIYRFIENFMKIVAAVTIAGLIFSVFHPQVLAAIPHFLSKLFNPLSVMFPKNWDTGDNSRLVTAIAFAGMGGFLNLLYSYWMKDKGVGMAKYTTKVSGFLTKQKETPNQNWLKFSDNLKNQRRWRSWLAYLNTDAFVAVLINAFTAALTTLLAFAILNPLGVYPKGWKITVVQAEFFRLSFGSFGALLFLLVAACFMSDTWLALVDGVSRQFADFFTANTRKKTFRFWYYSSLVFLILVTLITIPFAEPALLLTITGVISIFAFVFYIPALFYLNYIKIPKVYPKFVKPKRWEAIALFLTWLFYFTIALIYLLTL